MNDTGGQSNQNRTTRQKAITIHVEQRRKIVAELLSSGLSESEIARQLGKSKSTINEDVAAMKSQAVDFVYQLAKFDLCFFYSNTTNTLRRVRIEAFKIYEDNKNKPNIQLKALDTVIKAELAAFEVLSQGPLIMSVKALNERVDNLEHPKQEMTI